jgi:hypothetical protein
VASSSPRELVVVLAAQDAALRERVMDWLIACWASLRQLKRGLLRSGGALRRATTAFARWGETCTPREDGPIWGVASEREQLCWGRELNMYMCMYMCGVVC